MNSLLNDLQMCSKTRTVIRMPNGQSFSRTAVETTYPEDYLVDVTGIPSIDGYLNMVREEVNSGRAQIINRPSTLIISF